MNLKLRYLIFILILFVVPCSSSLANEDAPKSLERFAPCIETLCSDVAYDYDKFLSIAFRDSNLNKPFDTHLLKHKSIMDELTEWPLFDKAEIYNTTKKLYEGLQKDGSLQPKSNLELYAYYLRVFSDIGSSVYLHDGELKVNMDSDSLRARGNSEFLELDIKSVLAFLQSIDFDLYLEPQLFLASRLPNLTLHEQLEIIQKETKQIFRELNDEFGDLYFVFDSISHYWYLQTVKLRKRSEYIQSFLISSAYNEVLTGYAAFKFYRENKHRPLDPKAITHYHEKVSQIAFNQAFEPFLSPAPLFDYEFCKSQFQVLSNLTPTAARKKALLSSIENVKAALLEYSQGEFSIDTYRKIKSQFEGINFILPPSRADLVFALKELTEIDKKSVEYQTLMIKLNLSRFLKAHPFLIKALGFAPLESRTGMLNFYCFNVKPTELHDLTHINSRQVIVSQQTAFGPPSFQYQIIGHELGHHIWSILDIEARVKDVDTPLSPDVLAGWDVEKKARSESQIYVPRRFREETFADYFGNYASKKVPKPQNGWCFYKNDIRDIKGWEETAKDKRDVHPLTADRLLRTHSHLHGQLPLQCDLLRKELYIFNQNLDWQ